MSQICGLFRSYVSSVVDERENVADGSCDDGECGDELSLEFGFARMLNLVPGVLDDPLDYIIIFTLPPPLQPLWHAG